LSFPEIGRFRESSLPFLLPTDRAPYGPWTDDMKAVLGSQQEMTFTFYYQ
jgi:hypothetical protein